MAWNWEETSMCCWWGTRARPNLNSWSSLRGWVMWLCTRVVRVVVLQVWQRASRTPGKVDPVSLLWRRVLSSSLVVECVASMNSIRWDLRIGLWCMRPWNNKLYRLRRLVSRQDLTLNVVYWQQLIPSSDDTRKAKASRIKLNSKLPSWVDLIASSSSRIRGHPKLIEGWQTTFSISIRVSSLMPMNRVKWRRRNPQQRVVYSVWNNWRHSWSTLKVNLLHDSRTRQLSWWRICTFRTDRSHSRRVRTSRVGRVTFPSRWDNWRLLLGWVNR